MTLGGKKKLVESTEKKVEIYVQVLRAEFGLITSIIASPLHVTGSVCKMLSLLC